MTLKAYERFVVWLDYFNSELRRSEGRRVPLSSSTRAPTLPELEEACRRLSLEPESANARFPRAARRGSGYVSVKKTGAKQALLARIAKELSAIRGEAQKKPRKV